MRRATDSNLARRQFMIMWIDSKNNEQQQLKIKSYLRERGYDPVIKQYNNVRTFASDLRNTKIDILLISAQSVNANACESMIKKATKRYPFDILYYGVAKNVATQARLSLYSTVHILQSKQFLDMLFEMIDENSFKWQTPRFIRGLVIARSVDLEAVIDNYIISQLTLHNKQVSVQLNKKLYKIMYDYALAIRSKRLILEMLMIVNGTVDTRILKIIDKIAESRNRLAHSWLGVDESGTVVSSRARDASIPRKRFDKTRLWKILQDIDEVILYLDSITRHETVNK